MTGCMLYWAEGSKARNTVTFANSEVPMVKLFLRFLRECFATPNERITLRLNVYTGNGLRVRDIEEHWLQELELPRSSLRGHTLNHTPTSSSGKKKNRLPYGVAQMRVLKSTRLVQHILGAIQEYGGFDEPRWLDGPPVKRRPRKAGAQPQDAGNGSVGGNDGGASAGLAPQAWSGAAASEKCSRRPARSEKRAHGRP